MLVLRRYTWHIRRGIERRIRGGGGRRHWVGPARRYVFCDRLVDDRRQTGVLLRVRRRRTARVGVKDRLDVGRRRSKPELAVRARARVVARVDRLSGGHVGRRRQQFAVEGREDVCKRVGPRSQGTGVKVDLSKHRVNREEEQEAKTVESARTFRWTRYSSTRSRLVPRKSTLDRLRQNRMIVSSLLPDRSTHGRIVILRSRLIFSVKLTKSCDKVKFAISVECGRRYSLWVRYVRGYRATSSSALVCGLTLRTERGRAASVRRCEPGSLARRC